MCEFRQIECLTFRRLSASDSRLCVLLLTNWRTCESVWWSASYWRTSDVHYVACLWFSSMTLGRFITLPHRHSPQKTLCFKTLHRSEKPSLSAEPFLRVTCCRLPQETSLNNAWILIQTAKCTLRVQRGK